MCIVLSTFALFTYVMLCYVMKLMNGAQFLNFSFLFLLFLTQTMAPAIDKVPLENKYTCITIIT